jgi:hypothetical protein
MKRLSYEEVKKNIEKENYKLLSNEYKNCKQLLLVEHLKCGTQYNVNYSNFKQGKRCPKCAFNPIKNINEKKKLNINIVKERIQKIYNGEYIVLSETYINNSTPIKVQHIKCGFKYFVKPHNIMNGCGCPNCSPSKPLTTKIFKEKVFEMHGFEYSVLGEYKNNKTNILIKHNSDKCNFNEFEARPANFLSNETICPICAKSSKSKGERKIRKWLIENNFKFKQDYYFEYCKNINVLRYDFCIFLKDKLFLIEYDGRQHFKCSDREDKRYNLKLIQKRDKIKNDYCRNNNLDLLRIKYTDYKNIEKILIETFNDYPNGE